MADPPPEVIRFSLEWWEGVSNVVRNLVFLGGGGLAAYGIWLARQRTRAASLQAETAAKRLEVQTREDIERRVTEAFTRAIDQLGSERLEVRLGGIYALERISQESEEFHWPIMETLTAYVRENAPWPPREDNSQTLPRDSRLIKSEDRAEAATSEYADGKRIGTATDIAAILTVLGRRSEKERAKDTIEQRHLDLSGTDLRWAALSGAELPAVNFHHAMLDSAHLNGTNLEHAELSYAGLKEADLARANLQAATLFCANLRGANLSEANLQGADVS
jgi:hypothetical protein